MKRKLLRLAALGLAVIALFCLAACNKAEKADEGGKESPAPALELTDAERAEIIRFARAFRIYGEFDGTESFDLRHYEYMLYCLFTCELPESAAVRGCGAVSFEEADGFFEKAVCRIDLGGFKRTGYEPSQVQPIYSINGYYYVSLTDDSAFTYEITSVNEAEDEDGARIVNADVKVKGPEEEYCLSFELIGAEDGGLTVKKVGILEYM